MNNRIGSKNKIKNSNIGNNNTIETKSSDQSFFHRHPFFTAIVIPFIMGLLFLFSFWRDVVAYIENLFS